MDHGDRWALRALRTLRVLGGRACLVDALVGREGTAHKPWSLNFLVAGTLPSHPNTLPPTPPSSPATAAAVLVGAKLEDALPQTMYLEYFSPEYRLNYNRRKVWREGRGGVGMGRG